MKMNYLIARLAITVGLATVAALGVDGTEVTAGSGVGMRMSHASWVQNFSQPGQLARAADEIVIARAGQTRPGRVVSGPDGVGRVEYQLTDFSIEESLVDQSLQNITVERIGAASFDADGGTYVQGGTYVLFLNKQDGTGNYYLINDQARYSVTGDELKPTVSDEVTRHFEGRSVGYLVSETRRFREGR